MNNLEIITKNNFLVLKEGDNEISIGTNGNRMNMLKDAIKEIEKNTRDEEDEK